MPLPGPDYPAPAKLNLFLHVVGRRADGYHLLQSVFTLIDRCDALRLRMRDDGLVRRVNDVPGVPPEDDLVVRAARMLQRTAGTSKGVDIELDKRIPLGGGLGGGSSDAATALMALDRLWETRLSDTRLSWRRVSGASIAPFAAVGGPEAAPSRPHEGVSWPKRRFRASARTAVLKANDRSAWPRVAWRIRCWVTVTSETWKHIPIVNAK